MVYIGLPESQDMKDIRNATYFDRINDQFSYTQVGAHAHNGSDGTKLSFSSLTNRQFIIKVDLPGSSALPSGLSSPYFISTTSYSPTIFTYPGRVLAAGTPDAVVFPASWGVTHPGTGAYNITHNLGVSTYSVDLTPDTAPAVVVLASKGSIGFTVNVYNQNFTVLDNNFQFTLNLQNTPTTSSFPTYPPNNYGVFFTAPFNCTFLGATEVHQTAEVTATTLSLNIEHLTGVQASGSGTKLLISDFNLKGTANTVQTGQLAQLSNQSFYLKKGDRLGFVLTNSGSAQQLNGVSVSVTMVY